MQWNLNKSIGWESPNPDNDAVLYVKNKIGVLDSNDINKKAEFDSAALSELTSLGLGIQAEKDTPEESDYHLVVSKKYQRALDMLVSLGRFHKMQQQIIVYERRYLDWDRWEDHIIYPE